MHLQLIKRGPFWCFDVQRVIGCNNLVQNFSYANSEIIYTVDMVVSPAVGFTPPPPGGL